MHRPLRQRGEVAEVRALRSRLDAEPAITALHADTSPPSPSSLALQPAHTHLAQQVDLPGLLSVASPLAALPPLHRTLDALAPPRLRISTQLISPARSGFKLAT